jgi:hypothetical protein
MNTVRYALSRAAFWALATTLIALYPQLAAAQAI